MPLLQFTMQLPDKPTSTFVVGRLAIKEDKKADRVFKATSGCIGSQYHGCQNIRGRGALPSCSQAKISHYTVSTQALWMPQVKGVEGVFFPVAPFSVRLGNVTRGDFGIHFDANVPGSAGCIVLQTKTGWQTFVGIMADLHEARVKALPLVVSYD